MPRDKKIIHRATSDIEDSEIEEDQISIEDNNIIVSSQDHCDDDKQPLLLKQDEQIKHLIEERKKFLKDIILKRNLALKLQREKDRQQKVNSTK